MEEEAARQVASALNKSFTSPLGEFGEYLADKVRFLRWKAAIKTLEKARVIATKNGGQLNVPPVKFLLPFLEGCSLEEHDDEQHDDVTDLWANLLVDASSDFKSEQLVFIDVLKRLRPSGANVINVLAKQVELEDDEAEQLFALKSSIAHLKANFRNSLESSLLGASKSFPTDETVCEAIQNSCKNEPIVPAYASTPIKEYPNVCAFNSFGLSGVNYDEFELEALTRLGLLEFEEFDLSFEMAGGRSRSSFPRRLTEFEYDGPYYPMEFGAYFLTIFGLRFQHVCTDSKI